MVFKYDENSHEKGQKLYESNGRQYFKSNNDASSLI